MPELPEVETTARGIRQALVGEVLEAVVVRNPSLRWPVAVPADVAGQRVRSIDRRAKYLLFRLDAGSLIVHLGMSGRLRVQSNNVPPELHDHVDLLFRGGRVLRYTDPRRFGSIHWQPGPAHEHWLLEDLGVEPENILLDDFGG